MGVLAPGSANARPSAQPPINVSGNFSAILPPSLTQRLVSKQGTFVANFYNQPWQLPSTPSLKEYFCCSSSVSQSKISLKIGHTCGEFPKEILTSLLLPHPLATNIYHFKQQKENR